MIGTIDPSESVVIQQMRREMRVQGKALETERAYVGWVERFLRYCGVDQTDEMPAAAGASRPSSPMAPSSSHESVSHLSQSGTLADRRPSEAELADERLRGVMTIMSGVGESSIRTFLSMLAVEADVAPGTQGQAKSALLFLFQHVPGRQLGFLDVVSADKPERLPVAFSRS